MFNTKILKLLIVFLFVPLASANAQSVLSRQFKNPAVFTKTNIEKGTDNQKEQNENQIENTIDEGTKIFNLQIKQYLKDSASDQFSENLDFASIKQYFNLKNYLLLQQSADRYLNKFPQSEQANLVFYYWVISKINLKLALNDLTEVQKNYLSSLNNYQQSIVLKKYAQEQFLKGGPFKALEILFIPLENAGSENRLFNPLLKNKAITFSKWLDDPEQINQILSKYKDVDWVNEHSLELKIKALIFDKKFDQALTLVDQFLNNSNDTHTSLATLQQLKINIQNHSQTEPLKIGVILPLSSHNKTIIKIRQSVIEGIRLAVLSKVKDEPINVDKATIENIAPIKKVKNTDNNEDNTAIDPLDIEKNNEIEIIFKDTKLNAKITEKIIEELVEEHKVSAIVGPLIKSTSLVAARAAEKYQVPILSLSASPIIAKQNQWVFRNGYNWEDEIDILVKYAYSYHQARRFSVLYPESREGIQKKNLFVQKVRSLGAKIKAIQVYKNGDHSFKKPFDNLTGIRRYISKEEDQLRVELDEDIEATPKIDALFVVSARNGIENIRVILPYLQVYKMENVVLLGDNEWTNNSLLYANKIHLKNAFFVSEFYPDNSKNFISDFVRQHRRFYHKNLNYQKPNNYSAFGYDSVSILLELIEKQIEQQKLPNRVTVKQALTRLSNVNSLSGTLSFLPDGNAKRSLNLLKIKSNKMAPVFP